MPQEDEIAETPSESGENESGSGEGLPSDKVMPITKCPHTSRKHYAKVFPLILYNLQ